VQCIPAELIDLFASAKGSAMVQVEFDNARQGNEPPAPIQARI